MTIISQYFFTAVLKGIYIYGVQVVEDIFAQLKLKKPIAKFKASCFRSNLYYDVRFKDALEDPFEELRDFTLEALGPNWEDNRTVSGCPLFSLHAIR